MIRKLIYTFLLSGLLAAMSYASAPDLRADAKYAMDFACEYLEVSCRGIDPPIIVESPIVDELSYWSGRGLYGLTFPNDRYIFIDPHLEQIGVDRMQIIVHETVHYVLFWLGDPRGLDLCATEEVARQAEAAYTNSPYTADWREWYGCVTTN